MQAVPQQQLVRITTNTFAAKFRSKTEVYSFLMVDVGAYLPPRDAVTIYFLKDLVCGNRKCKSITQFTNNPSGSASSSRRSSHIFHALDIKAADIKVLHAPLYKGLTIEAILEQFKDKPQVWHYLPEKRDLHRLPRQFIIDVIYTVVG